ncbi:MAG: hypothetical protein ACOX9R_03130 [Armatimonadota bacterium]
MKLCRVLPAAIVALIICLPALAQGGAPADQVVMPRLAAAPTIDGDLSDAAWQGAPALENWTIPLTTQAPPKDCAVRLGFDDSGIYVGARFEEPQPETLQMEAPDGGSDVWRDDCLEVWVRTSGNRADFDQFIVNAAGARQRVRGRVGSHETPAPEFPAATAIGDDHWSVELFIAYEEIGLEGTPEPGTMIQLKFGREDPSGRETTLSHWPPRAPYGASEGYGRAYFVSSNLLPNADFTEMNAGGQPAGWGLHELVEGRIEVAEDQGRQALRWETVGSYATIQRSLRLEPKALYRLEAWTRGDAGIYLRARTRKTADQEGTDRYDVNTRPSEDYAYHSVTFPTGEEGTAQLILGNTEDLGAGTVYLSGLAIVREAGMEVAGPAIPVIPGQTLRITDIDVAECRSLRGFVGAPMDGRLDSVAWNGSVWEYGAPSAGAGVYYDFANGDGLNLRLADTAGVDAVQLRGGAKVKLYRDATSYHEPGEGELLWDWQANAQSSRALFGERVMTDRFSFFDLEDGFISDLYFFRLGEDDPLPEPTVLNVQQQIDLPAQLTAAAGQFDSEPGEARGLAATEMAVALEQSEGDWVHFVTEPMAEDTGLLAVGLLLDMPDAPTGLPLEVAVLDPFSPAHRVMNVELTVEGAGVSHVVLDHLDQIVPEGRPVWVALRTGADVRLNMPRVELYYAPVAEALTEALEYRLWIVKTMFAALSEPRPWLSLRSRDVDLDAWAKDAYAGEKVVELLDEIAFAVELAPGHPLVQQYDLWVWQGAGLPEFEPGIDEVAGAPEWAVVLRQAWLEAREVPRWWLEHRLVPTGEMGGRVNDDTCMYQNYAMFPMISDDPVARALIEATAALALHAEQNTLEQGLNRRSMDPLHAYEEGLNHLAMMTWWHHGDPVYFERALTSARSLPALTVTTERGHRHFKNQTLGAEDLRIDRELGVDGHAHPLMLHPAFEVLWYNRHPRVEQFLREWADGWLEHQQQGAYATSVDVATEEPTQVYEDRPVYGGYGGQASAFYSMIEHTGDARYARPFMDMLERGRASFRVADYLPEFYQRGLLDHLDEQTMLALEERDAYLPVLTRGDRGPLIEALRNDIAHLQRFKYMYTEAEQFTDRIFLPSVYNAAKAYCGAYTTRNKYAHPLSVSWEGFGTDFAALVLEAGDDRLKAAVYSFANEPMEGALRVWRLENGRYRVAVGIDEDRDDAFDRPVETRELQLRRHSLVPVTLEPGQVTLVEIEQIERLDPVFERADLALSELNTVVEGGVVRGTVHNIGRAGVESVVLALLNADGEVVASETLTEIPGIGEDLQPVRVEYELAGVPAVAADAAGWRVVIDHEGAVEEIYEGNNVVWLGATVPGVRDRQ